jgi:hypothetical protein
MPVSTRGQKETFLPTPGIKPWEHNILSWWREQIHMIGKQDSNQFLFFLLNLASGRFHLRAVTARPFSLNITRTRDVTK